MFMNRNWENDINNIIVNSKISNENIELKKKQIKQNFENNKNNIIYEYSWNETYSDNYYSGTYDDICNKVSKVILNHLEEEKAIMELISENYMYPVGGNTEKYFDYTFRYRCEMNGGSSSSAYDFSIKTIPYKYFRKL